MIFFKILDICLYTYADVRRFLVIQNNDEASNLIKLKIIEEVVKIVVDLLIYEV